jgi:hypothetical protein
LFTGLVCPDAAFYMMRNETLDPIYKI